MQLMEPQGKLLQMRWHRLYLAELRIVGADFQRLWCKPRDCSEMIDRCRDSCRSKSSLRGDTLTRRSSCSCIRWYLSCKLSYRDLVAMTGERGIERPTRRRAGAYGIEFRGTAFRT